jgi:hypothetical protein
MINRLDGVGPPRQDIASRIMAISMPSPYVRAPWMDVLSQMMAWWVGMNLMSASK